MNIKEIKILNFLTIGEAKLKLSERGLLLIQGVNEDDSSADSNGSGKSSLADALCWGIYGTTARDVTADSVVNNKSKKDCMVETLLDDGSNEYRITRYRKDSTNKNQTLVVQERPGMPPVVLTKGTEKETQEVIDKIVGCSLDVFQTAVYAGQEKMPDLPAMTDKQLKLMIEEAAGVEVLSKAHAAASKRFNSVSGQMVSLVAKLDTFKRQAEFIKEDSLENTKQFDAYEAGRKDKAKEELAKTVPKTAAIKTLQDNMASLAAEGLQKSLDEVELKLASLSAESLTYDKMMKEAHNASNTTVRLRSKAERMKEDIEKLKSNLADIASQVGKPCGECGKEYHEEDLEGATKALKVKIDAAAKDFQTALLELRTARDEEKTLTDAATAFKATMTDVSALAVRQSALASRITLGKSYARDISLLEMEVENLKSAAKLWLKNDNPYTKARATIALRASANDSEITSVEESIAKLKKEYDLLDSAVKVFGPAGVRAHILDTVTPFLNDRTAHYLSALSDGNIHAVWNTLTKNAKGELKEKFNIEVSNDKGGDSFAGISGGEKRKVRLACALALQDMVASRATKPINIFVADEIDDALDPAGMERLMTILNEKAKERGTVIVVSHNSLTDWIDEVITVTKRGKGASSVSGATGV